MGGGSSVANDKEKSYITKSEKSQPNMNNNDNLNPFEDSPFENSSQFNATNNNVAPSKTNSSNIIGGRSNRNKKMTERSLQKMAVGRAERSYDVKDHINFNKVEERGWNSEAKPLPSRVPPPRDMSIMYSSTTATTNNSSNFSTSGGRMTVQPRPPSMRGPPVDPRSPAFNKSAGNNTSNNGNARHAVRGGQAPFIPTFVPSSVPPPRAAMTAPPVGYSVPKPQQQPSQEQLAQSRQNTTTNNNNNNYTSNTHNSSGSSGGSDGPFSFRNPYSAGEVPDTKSNGNKKEESGRKDKYTGDDSDSEDDLGLDEEEGGVYDFTEFDTAAGLANANANKNGNTTTTLSSIQEQKTQDFNATPTNAHDNPIAFNTPVKGSGDDDIDNNRLAINALLDGDGPLPLDEMIAQFIEPGSQPTTPSAPKTPVPALKLPTTPVNTPGSIGKPSYKIAESPSSSSTNNVTRPHGIPRPAGRPTSKGTALGAASPSPSPSPSPKYNQGLTPTSAGVRKSSEVKGSISGVGGSANGVSGAAATMASRLSINIPSGDGGASSNTKSPSIAPSPGGNTNHVNNSNGSNSIGSNANRTPPRGPGSLPAGSPSLNMAAGGATSGNMNTTNRVSIPRPSNLVAKPPSKGTSSSPNVRETKDVKRNRVQLPSGFTHAKPTTGDWLKKRYIVNNYIMLDTLGTGSYGEVRMCKDRKTDLLYAMKIISKEMLKKKKGGNTDETYFEDIKREIAIMKKLLHPNVLRLFEVLDDPKVNKLYLLVEYMKKGDLVNVLKSRGMKGDGMQRESESSFQPLPDIEIWNIFRQVAAGIRYLHYQNIVHGDIKPQNLLIGEDQVVKIADFGISKMLHASGQKLVDAAGTPAFMSPELCGGENFSGQLADIWALGGTIFMLKYGHPPFRASNIIALYKKIQEDKIVWPEDIPINPGLKNLLNGMLTKDPKRRFSLQQVITHPWMRSPPTYSGAQGEDMTKQKDKSIDKDKSSNKESDGSSGDSAVDFRPTSAYHEEQERAMNSAVHNVDDKDMFASISGVIVSKEAKTKSKSKSSSGSVTDSNSLSSATGSSKEDDDIMATKWGNDVFEYVDDDIGSDSDDDEEVDDTNDVADDKGKNDNYRKYKLGQGQSNTKEREMSKDEEEERTMRFKSKKSMGLTSKTEPTAISGIEIPKNGGQTLKNTLGSPDAGVFTNEPPLSNSSVHSEKSIGGGSPNSKASRALRRRSTIGGLADDDILGTEELDDTGFENLMDTLALQPTKMDSSTSIAMADIEPGTVAKLDAVPVQLSNIQTGVGAAFYCEQGQRDHQEDRCLLIPDIAKMRAIEKWQFENEQDVRKQLSNISMACVFDGHSGVRCAQLLAQHLAGKLVTHKGFLKAGKNGIDAAIQDTFEEMDKEICETLALEKDGSGSTCVLTLFDGRKKLFTVANTGDSMCVLSRGGRAVRLHRLHRLGGGQGDVEERKRVEAAGGKVINSRVNGVLAISRAFGDIQMKYFGGGNGRNTGPVICSPDIHSEIITPMTEFAVIGTDGLWDTMDPQQVINFVRQRILKKEGPLQETAQLLCREALARGSVDNITALIVSFHLEKTSDQI